MCLCTNAFLSNYARRSRTESVLGSVQYLDYSVHSNNIISPHHVCKLHILVYSQWPAQFGLLMLAVFASQKSYVCIYASRHKITRKLGFEQFFI